MRYSLVLLSVCLASCVSRNVDGFEPRDVCGNGLDDDGDGHLDGADQDCWPADAGAPQPDAGGCAADAVNVRLYWRSDLDLRYAQIQGCLGERCNVERFVGMDGECSSATGTVICRLNNVSIGARLDFNGYGERSDGSAVWGVGLDGEGRERTVGTMFVSEDLDRDSTYDVDRTGAVRTVGITNGGGRNWSYVVGR